jgi:nucleoside-diphosphate-sugar epimerase
MTAASALAEHVGAPGNRRHTIAKILVIGASGFVGAAIVRAAMARPDMRPIACMRRANPGLYHLGVETRACDAADPAALANVLRGVTYAVNCVLGSPATMIAATRNLCEAARTSGLQRIVHLSSMAVYGPAAGKVDETTALRPSSAYGRAKAECEAVIREFGAAGGDAVVIRPGCVYGPGGEQWVGRIARWLLSGRLGELGDMAGGNCNLTFNDDLAAAVISLLTAPNAAGETFNIADGDPGTWDQYFKDLGCAIGAPVRRVSRLRMRMETAILAPPLQIARIAGQRIGIYPAVLPEPITPSLLRLWRQPMRLSSQKIDMVLRSPCVMREQGLALSADWFRSTVMN